MACQKLYPPYLEPLLLFLWIGRGRLNVRGRVDERQVMEQRAGMMNRDSDWMDTSGNQSATVPETTVSVGFMDGPDRKGRI